MKKTIIVILIICAMPALADSPFYFNVGIKLGFSFQKKGFHIGPEISMVKTFGNQEFNNIIGGYINVDFYMDGRIAFNPGFELQVLPYPGVCMGPSMLFYHDSLNVGASFSIYHGAILYPYFGYTWFPETNGFFELGSFAKIPVGNTPHFINFN